MGGQYNSQRPNGRNQYGITDDDTNDLRRQFESKNSEMPSTEGYYYMTGSDGVRKQVQIQNLALSDKHPKNLHVFQSPTDYYALSIENGCDEFTWELIPD